MQEPLDRPATDEGDRQVGVHYREGVHRGCLERERGRLLVVREEAGAEVSLSTVTEQRHDSGLWTKLPRGAQGGDDISA